MFRLTRQVRFAVNLAADDQSAGSPTNSYGGFPSLTGFGQYFTVDVSVTGQADSTTGFLCNTKAIDAIARATAPQIVSSRFFSAGQQRCDFGFNLPVILLDTLRERFEAELPGVTLDGVQLRFTPFLTACCLASEHPMIRLSQRFEFSASHRLHHASFSDAENLRTFGKCSNPHGHGHNYELEVTLTGNPDAKGLLIEVPAFERIVTQTVIDRFDHKNLNIELAEFQDVIPTVENIAKVIYGMLKPKFEGARARLASVTVWETPKTWCEYSE